jgi:hypothetical protein
MSFSRDPRNQPSRRKPNTWEEFIAAQKEATGPGKEVLSHIYQAILKTPAFTLTDGTKCRVDALFEPDVNADGDLKCGFDVLLGEAGHLEFTVTQTGWGRALAPKRSGGGLVPEPAKQLPKRARGQQR